MKRTVLFCSLVLIVVLAGTVIPISPFSIPGSIDREAVAASQGPNPRFYEVAEKLDEGGNFYLYMDLKDFLRNLFGVVEDISKGLPMPPGGPNPMAMVEGVIETLGLFGIEDLGMSAVDLGEIQRSSFFLRIPSEQQGIFKLLGGPPHAFGRVEYAPQDTGYFATGDVDLVSLLDLAREVLQQIGGPAMVMPMEQGLKASGEAFGLDIEKTIRSLAGDFTVVLRLNPEKKIELPAEEEGETHTLPFPELAVLVGVEDTTLYDSIRSVFDAQRIKYVEAEGDPTKIQIEVPEIEGYTLDPVIVQREGLLAAASHDSYLDHILKARAAGESLSDNESFQKMIEGLPVQGNGLAYVSREITEAIQDVMREVMSADDEIEGLMLENIYDSIPYSNSQAFVRVNDPNGLRMVTNRTPTKGPNPEALALAAVPAILVAIALPNFLEARTRAQTVKAKGEVRAMSVALESYYLDWNQYPASADFETLISEGPGGEANWKGQTPLTTPVKYLVSIPLDPNSENGEGPFFYFRPEPERDPELSELEARWIVWGMGPDENWNIRTKADLKRAFDPMSDLHFSPTNGIKSSGDAIFLSN